MRITGLVVLVSLLLLAWGCTSREVTDVRFFYQELCPGCESYDRAQAIVVDLLTVSRKRRDLTAKSHNMIDPASYSILLEEIRKRGLPDISRNRPLLFVDDNYYIGYDSIEAIIEIISR